MYVPMHYLEYTLHIDIEDLKSLNVCAVQTRSMTRRNMVTDVESRPDQPQPTIVVPRIYPAMTRNKTKSFYEIDFKITMNTTYDDTCKFTIETHGCQDVGARSENGSLDLHCNNKTNYIVCCPCLVG